jgi:hypothetical protein
MACPLAAEWRTAINIEIGALEKLHTWIVVDIPFKCHLKTGAFIFTVKYTGETLKYKARLIAHGYRQIEAVDYWETYAPVTCAESIRIILALAASQDMIIDFDTAF